MLMKCKNKSLACTLSLGAAAAMLSCCAVLYFTTRGNEGSLVYRRARAAGAYLWEWRRLQRTGTSATLRSLWRRTRSLLGLYLLLCRLVDLHTMGHVSCMESGSKDCTEKVCPVCYFCNSAPWWQSQQMFWPRRAAMERQEGRISSTFRHVVPVSDSGQTNTVLDLKKLRKHHQQLLVDRGAFALQSDLRWHRP